jgi:pimeloyl-ACP methyl ester carboxylesterase
MPMIRVRDMDMHYEIHGSPNAEPLVLMHGFTGAGRDFEPFISQLSQHYRLYIPDWRGHGRTTNPSGTIIHYELALDTAAFAAALGLERAHYCGFSSGGMHLLFLTLEHPRLVHTLTLVSASFTFDDFAKTKVKEARDSVRPEYIASMNAKHGENHGSDYVAVLLDLWANSVIRPNELPFTPEHLRRITCPTLIMHGDRDTYFPIQIPLTMHQAIQKSNLCILPDCGHFLPWEINPLLFSSILLDFLKKHPIPRQSPTDGPS